MIRVRIDNYSAAAGPPDGYGIHTVRLTRGGTPGESIGTINYDDAKGFWAAITPEVDGFSEGTYEPSATEAARWLLKDYIREKSRS